VYDSFSARWTVEVQHENSKVILHPKHLVLATGHGRPRIPTWNGMNDFQGTLYHSDFHRDAEKFRGKRVVVIGAVSRLHFSLVGAYKTFRATLVVTYVKIL
jgi:cation diffusion facilitator CzcD-associated flavoprotein CzcO